MIHHFKDSSHLVDGDYSPASHTLKIKFRGDSVYEYEGVDEELWQRFKDSHSAGSFFHEHIKRKGGKRLKAL